MGSEMCHERHTQLFDHLVGAGEQRGADFKPDGFGGPEIDYQFEPGWLFDRKIGRLGSAQRSNKMKLSFRQSQRAVTTRSWFLMLRSGVAQRTRGGDKTLLRRRCGCRCELAKTTFPGNIR